MLILTSLYIKSFEGSSHYDDKNEKLVIVNGQMGMTLYNGISYTSLLVALYVSLYAYIKCNKIHILKDFVFVDALSICLSSFNKFHQA